MTPLKKCTGCGADKPRTTEHFNKKLGGLTSRCRVCLSASRRADDAARARNNEARRRSRAQNPEAVRAKDRARYGPKKREAVAAWRAANPEKKREIDRRYYERNREAVIARAVQYAAARPEQTRASGQRLHQRRQASSPAYRLNRSIKSAMNISLNGGKAGRRWSDLVGYSREDLMAHLERQFTKGMNWTNYGEWHVDHIVPLAAHEIDSAESEAFKAAWALTNLRPMWASDNIRKGPKRLLLL